MFAEGKGAGRAPASSREMLLLAPGFQPASGRQRGLRGREADGAGGEAEESFSVSKIHCACEVWAQSSKEMK